MFSITCSGCNVARVLKNRPKSGVKSCMKCSLDRRALKPKITYTRTCVDCGDIAILKHRSHATRCASCSCKMLGKQLSQGNRKEEKDKIKYTYLCPTCPDVMVKGAKRKGTYCGACSRKYSRLVKPNIYYDYETNTMMGDTRQVKTAASSGFVACRSCSKIGNNGGRKLGAKDSRKRNLKARTAKMPAPIYTNSEKVVITIAPKITQEEEDAKCRAMIDSWLRSNKPTAIEQVKLPDSMIGQTYSSTYIKGY